MLSIVQTNILWSLLNNFNQFINQTFNSYTNLEKVLIKMKNVINCTGCFMGTLTKLRLLFLGSKPQNKKKSN